MNDEAGLSSLGLPTGLGGAGEGFWLQWQQGAPSHAQQLSEPRAGSRRILSSPSCPSPSELIYVV